MAKKELEKILIGEQLKKVKEVLDPEKTTKKVIDATSYLRKEYKKTLAVALTTGLALIIGLYVKDLLTLWIDYLLKALSLSEGTGIMYKTILTLVVSGIAVLGIVLVSKWAGKEEKK